MDYVDCNKAALKNWERDQKKHQMSLQTIKVLPGLVDNRPPATFNAAYFKAEAKRFYVAERDRAIRSENQKLMTKLIEISGGKGRFSARIDPNSSYWPQPQLSPSSSRSQSSAERKPSPSYSTELPRELLLHHSVALCVPAEQEIQGLDIQSAPHPGSPQGQTA